MFLPLCSPNRMRGGTGCCASLGTSHRSSFRPSPQPRRASLPARALVSVDYRHGCVNLDRGACHSVRQTLWFGDHRLVSFRPRWVLAARSLTRAEISAPVHRANLVSAQGQSEALPMADQGAILAFVERLVAAGLHFLHLCARADAILWSAVGLDRLVHIAFRARQFLRTALARAAL